MSAFSSSAEKRYFLLQKWQDSSAPPSVLSSSVSSSLPSASSALSMRPREQSQTKRTGERPSVSQPRSPSASSASDSGVCPCSYSEVRLPSEDRRLSSSSAVRSSEPGMS